MSSERAEAWRDRQHFVVAAVLLWLIATSPWVAMLRRIPSGAGFFDYAHVALGFVALLLSVTYALACMRAGGWRLYFPWASGGLAAVGRDVSGLLRGRVPSAEGGGLFAMIEGLLLIALGLAAATGAAWYLAQGSDAALALRDMHILAARGLTVLVILHVLAVASHLLDFA